MKINKNIYLLTEKKRIKFAKNIKLFGLKWKIFYEINYLC